MIRKALFALACILFLLCGHVTAVFSADHVEFTDRHSFENDTVEQLIEVWALDDDYDYDEAQAMIDRIGKIPERMIKNTVDNDVKLLFIDFPLVELDEYSHLVGEVPRGWEGRGYTWDDVPGAGGRTTVARIGYSAQGELHNSINLEYHEYGHAIDNYTFNEPLSTTEEFRDLHIAEQQSLFGDDPYFDYAEEYFAEALAYYFSGGNYKEQLKEKAPETYRFFDTLEESVLTVENSDEHGIELSWESVDDAVTYEVFRDREKIEETESLSFTDAEFHEHTNHLYGVQALDESGEVIHQTFEVSVLTEEKAVVEEVEEISEDVADERAKQGEAEDTTNFNLSIYVIL